MCNQLFPLCGGDVRLHESLMFYSWRSARRIRHELIFNACEDMFKILTCVLFVFRVEFFHSVNCFVFSVSVHRMSKNAQNFKCHRTDILFDHCTDDIIKTRSEHLQTLLTLSLTTQLFKNFDCSSFPGLFTGRWVYSRTKKVLIELKTSRKMGSTHWIHPFLRAGRVSGRLLGLLMAFFAGHDMHSSPMCDGAICGRSIIKQTQSNCKKSASMGVWAPFVPV